MYDRAVELDNINDIYLYQQALEKEMNNIQVTLDINDEGVAASVGYQYIGCHTIFDIKATTLTRKFWFILGGHAMDTPASMTYASVLSRESVRVALLLAAFNDLDIFSTELQNDYLDAPPR